MTSKQRAYLMSLASNESSFFQIGKSNLTPEITNAVKEAFNNRELLKITVLKNAEEKPIAMANVLAERVGCQLVQVIGRKIVLYKENTEFVKNKDKRHIVLPR